MPSGARTITGVATSITAFVGRALRGPTGEPVTIHSFAEFERVFGGLWSGSALGFAVRDFYANGGKQAIVVRLYRGDADPATSEGLDLDEDDFTGAGKAAAQQGLYALEKADLFNLLCLPPYRATAGIANQDVDSTLVGTAADYCERRRAMLIVDPPSDWKVKDDAKRGVANVGTTSGNAALYFPRLKLPDPARGGQIGVYAPSGAVCGTMARTDGARGVWKAPAGSDATLANAVGLSVSLTEDDSGELNRLGVNCLRAMPAMGHVVWGARTLQGDDRLASEWKYIPVRRTALFIEESLLRGTRWAVFEPNSEPLWAQIRLNAGAFLHNLFRQGAFAGRTPREAYYVKCDEGTTTQTDVDLGAVNIEVGFAPLKAAEFVRLKIRQQAGRVQT